MDSDLIEGIVWIVIAVAFVGLIVFSIWKHFNAPCSSFGYYTLKDVPVRCLKEFANINQG